MGYIKEQYITDEEAKNFILGMCQQLYSDTVSFIKLERLRELDSNDNIFSILIRYIKFQLEFSYLKMLAMEFKDANNFILNNLNTTPRNLDLNITEETLETYENIMRFIPVKVIIDVEKDYINIPVSYEKDEHGYYQNVWLEKIPLKELNFLYDSPIHKNVSTITPLDNELQDLTEYKTLRCDDKYCILIITDLYSVYYLARKYNQYRKVLNSKTYIKVIERLYLFKIENFVKFKLGRLNGNEYFTYLSHINKTKIKPQNLCLFKQMLTTRYEDLKHNFCKRFLKFLRQEFRNIPTLEQLYRFIYGYNNREWNFIAKDQLEECFPFIKDFSTKTEGNIYQAFFLLEDINKARIIVNKIIGEDCRIELQCYNNILNRKIKNM